jgi:2-polyprenyl-3-methyl-5-hydroxy-6-metoxy-1,4-benzoquinol methylase
MFNLKQRHRLPELMDQPNLDRARHVQALRGLERINFLSGSAGILWPPIRDLLRQPTGAPLRILDLATGAGDVPIALWRRARRLAGRPGRCRPVQIDGWDVSPVAVDHAQRRASETGAEVHFRQADALSAEVDHPYDVVTCSLFLHHLDEDQAIVLLQRMARAAHRLMLVNDLVRCRAGFILAHVATRLLSTSDVVHTDGPRSVAGAFTLAEVRALAERAGLHGARIVRRWPFRLLLSWEAP